MNTTSAPATDSEHDRSTAAIIRHVASLIEQATSGARSERGEAGPSYWAGVDDVTEWWVRHLRDNAATITRRAQRLHHLRTLAERASAGTWGMCPDSADGQSTLHTDADDRLGKLVRTEDARYIASVQPAVILQLLDALDDPTAPSPDLDSLEDAARHASHGAWGHCGIFMTNSAGTDLGWLHRSCDVDYIIAAEPSFTLDLVDMLRMARDHVSALASCSSPGRCERLR